MFKVILEGNIPNGICLRCLHNLKISHKFRKLAEASNSTLFGKHVNVEEDDFHIINLPMEEEKNIDHNDGIQNVFKLPIAKPFALPKENIENKLAANICKKLSHNEQNKFVFCNTVIKRIDKSLTPENCSSEIEKSTLTINSCKNVSNLDSSHFKASHSPLNPSSKVISKVQNKKEKRVIGIIKESEELKRYFSNCKIGTKRFSKKDAIPIKQLKLKKSTIVDDTVCKNLVLDTPKSISLLKSPHDKNKKYNTNKYQTISQNSSKMSIIPIKDNFPENFENIKDIYKSRSREKHICPVCGLLTFGLASHLLTHEETKPYSCNQCSRAFVQKANYEMHMKRHTGIKDQICEICGSSFFFHKSLIRHKLIHKGDRPFSCNLCPKKFIVKCDLTRHLKIHAGYKPFKCTQCSMAFNAKHQLINHVRMHTGEKPFICEICDLAFTYKVNLNNHCIKVHNFNIKFKSIHKVTAEILTEQCELIGDISNKNSLMISNDLNL